MIRFYHKRYNQLKKITAYLAKQKMERNYPTHDYKMTGEEGGLKKVCQYAKEKTCAAEKDPSDPHVHRERQPPQFRIMNDITETIGNTPLVRLNAIPKTEGIKCEMRKR